MAMQKSFKIEAYENLHTLAENPYPGRGFVQGLNQLGDTALQAYWVMGRSEGSQNRILVQEAEVVRTEIYDESKIGPSDNLELIVYNALRSYGKQHVVSNGRQTDAVISSTKRSGTFKSALSDWEYEPDAPNYTPRITGMLRPFLSTVTGPLSHSDISVISKDENSDRPIHKHYKEMLTSTYAGIGLGVHTYLGDGSPLPSYNKRPQYFPLGEGVVDTAEMYWDALDTDNRVALVVKGIHKADNSTSYHIINAHEQLLLAFV